MRILHTSRSTPPSAHISASSSCKGVPERMGEREGKLGAAAGAATAGGEVAAGMQGEDGGEAPERMRLWGYFHLDLGFPFDPALHQNRQLTHNRMNPVRFLNSMCNRPHPSWTYSVKREVSKKITASDGRERNTT